MQFSMVPLNFLPADGVADYVSSGTWSKKASRRAKRCGRVNVAATTEETNFNHLPTAFNYSADAAYVHFTTNETIHGVEFMTEPYSGDKPLICDMSSDIASHPLNVAKYALIYAGAQKNLGPAGATLVILREDMLERVPEGLHTMLDYKVMAENDSLYNTPPCFGIYIIGLVAKHWLGLGGLRAVAELNQRKAGYIYQAIDGSDGFYRGHAEKAARSLMNITFRMPTEDLEKQLISEATAAGFNGLKGTGPWAACERRSTTRSRWRGAKRSRSLWGTSRRRTARGFAPLRHRMPRSTPARGISFCLRQPRW